jgi:hypothetical protein
MHWLYDVPFWISGPLICAGLIAIAIAGLLAVRRWVLPRLAISSEDSHFVGPLVHSVMVFYGLVLALIAVRVFDAYSETAHVVSSEATTVAALYRDLGGYPEPVRTALRASVRDYVDQVIHEAWPQMRAGVIPLGGVRRMNVIQAQLAAFEPKTEGQKIVHAQVIREFSEFIEVRRQRLDRVRESLPGVQWMVVLLGAAIALSAAFFFHVEDVRLHVILVSLLALFIATVIFVMFSMDHPFRGDLRITAESYQLIYEQLMDH